MNAVSSEDSTAAAVSVAAAAAASPEKAGMLDRVAHDTAPGDMDLRPQTLLRTLCHGQPQLKIPGRRAWATSRDDEQMTVALGYVYHTSTVRGAANTVSTNSTPLILALPIHLDSSELNPSTANEPQRMKHLSDNGAKRPTKPAS
jgi:hypothetical protein